MRAAATAGPTAAATHTTSMRAGMVTTSAQFTTGYRKSPPYE